MSCFVFSGLANLNYNSFKEWFKKKKKKLGKAFYSILYIYIYKKSKKKKKASKVVYTIWLVYVC